MAGVKSGAYTTVYVNTGTVAIPVWTAVAIQDGTSFAESPQLADVGGKEDWPYQVGELVALNETITLTGTYSTDEASLTMLKTACSNGDLVQLREYRNGAAVQGCDAKITSFNHDHPKFDRASYSISFQRESDWTAV